MRQDIQAAPTAGAELGIVKSLLAFLNVRIQDPDGTGVNRLRVFLAANRDIQLTADELRLSLALRDDRFWRGVTEAFMIKEAIDAGDALRLTATIDTREGSARTQAIDRSVAFVEGSRRFPRIASRGIEALLPQASDPLVARRLYS